MTPLYDVLLAQLSLVVGQHFIQTGEGAGLSKVFVREAIEEMADTAVGAIEKMEGELPADFPEVIHRAVKAGVTDRLSKLAVN